MRQSHTLVTLMSKLGGGVFVRSDKAAMLLTPQSQSPAIMDDQASLDELIEERLGEQSVVRCCLDVDGRTYDALLFPSSDAEALDASQQDLDQLNSDLVEEERELEADEGGLNSELAEEVANTKEAIEEKREERDTIYKELQLSDDIESTCSRSNQSVVAKTTDQSLFNVYFDHIPKHEVKAVTVALSQEDQQALAKLAQSALREYEHVKQQISDGAQKSFASL